jgi:hypothetical protein
MYQTYKDQGFIIITLLTENYDQVPPNQAELQGWADEYGLTHPVVSDGERYIHSFGTKGTGPGGTGPPGVKFPSFTLLGPGAELLIVDKDITAADIEAALP